MLKNFNKLLTNNIIYLVVIFMTTLSIFNNIIPLQEIKKTNSELKKELKHVTSEEENKKEEIRLLNDKETKEEVARKTYKISKKDEILFIFPD